MKMTASQPLSGKTSEEISQLANSFLEKIPRNTRIGNKSLRDKLEWSEDLYISIKRKLIEDGKIMTGRGQGGSVFLPPDIPEEKFINNPPDNSDSYKDEAPQNLYVNEKSLYKPILDTIRTTWKKEQGFDDFIAEDTSFGGRRPDGVWARPDITVVAYTAYAYVPGKIFDVITFEIKNYNNISVTAVYEALAHRRAATRSYVLIQVSQDKLDEFKEIKLPDVADEAARHGIGIIIATDPGNYDTWEIKEEPSRINPDPMRLDKFIREQLPEGTRDQIIKWFRS